MYKLINDILGKPYMVQKDGNTFIPFDSANTDYQAYLVWLSEGNTPLPADEPQGES